MLRPTEVSRVGGLLAQGDPEEASGAANASKMASIWSHLDARAGEKAQSVIHLTWACGS